MTSKDLLEQFGWFRAEIKSLLAFLFIIILTAGCSSGGSGGGEGILPQAQANPAEEQGLTDLRVFPPSSKPYGKFYGEWSAEWWQWVLSIPAPENPLLDETGEKCMVGQRGPVWFLAGVFNVSGKATRNCAVPDGTALLIPLLNTEWDNIGAGTPLKVEELRASAKSAIDGVTDLAVEVDGIPILNVEAFRFTSPIFSFTVPKNDVYTGYGISQTYYPAAGDGYYVMLKPLSVGDHTLRIQGRLAAFDFSLDIIYHLKIVPVTLQ